MRHTEDGATLRAGVHGFLSGCGLGKVGCHANRFLAVGALGHTIPVPNGGQNNLSHNSSKAVVANQFNSNMGQPR